MKKLTDSALLQGMFTQATIGIVVVDDSGKIIYVNPLAGQQFGYSPDELSNQPIDVLVPNSNNGRHAKHRHHYHKNPQPRLMGAGRELEALRKDGSTFPIEISLSPIEVAGKNLVIAFVHDISERVKTSNALKESESRFRSIVEKLPAGAVIVDNDSIFLNAAAEKITGYASDEFSSVEDWFVKLCGDQATAIQETYTADLKVGFPQNRIIRLQRKDGEERMVNFQGSQFADGVAWLLNDITASQKAEKILSENQSRLENYAIDLENAVKLKTKQLGVSEEKLIQASQLAKIGYWELNFNEGEPTAFFSKEYCALYDVAENEPGDDRHYFLQFIEEKDQGYVRERTKRAIKEGRGNFFFRAKTTKGRAIFLNAELRVIYDDQGKLETVFSMVQDITQQKQAEIQLEKSLEKERELGQLKSRFVSMASHEFRTPLTSILSSVSLIEMLIDRGRMDDQKKYVRRIESSVANMTSILNDFLSLEKLESGKVTIKPAIITIKEFINELQDDVSPMLKEEQQFVHQHEGGLEVELDPHLMKNILLNLLSNAIKYSPKASSVLVKTIQEDKHLTIAITDQGIGIPEEEQKHMFTRFFRANNAANIKGTGLGLTIVKRYLDLIGGEISFSSVENEGSTFEIQIPLG